MIRSLIPVSIISSLVYLFYAFLMPSNHTWLHGEWVYEDQLTRGAMVFRKDGTAEVKSPDGTLDCIYGYLAAKVSVQCEISGTKKELRYSVSADRKTLSGKGQKSRLTKTASRQT